MSNLPRKTDVIIDRINKSDKKKHFFSESTIREFEMFIPNDVKDIIIGEKEELVAYSKTMLCDHCGCDIPIIFKNSEVLIQEECEFPFQNLDVEVDFSSGKIINAEYLVYIAEHIGNNSDFSFSRTYHHLFLELQHFAKNQVFFPSIPNGQPHLYLKDDIYHLVEGSDSSEEDVISWDGQKPLKERLGCFFIDYDKAMKMKMAFEILGMDMDEMDDIKIIDVPKGIYKCSLIKEATRNRGRKENEVFVVGTMTKITS